MQASNTQHDHKNIQLGAHQLYSIFRAEIKPSISTCTEERACASRFHFIW